MTPDEWRPFDEHAETAALARHIATDPDNPTPDDMATAGKCRALIADFREKWRAKAGPIPWGKS